MNRPRVIEASQAQLDELVALAVAASFPQPQQELLEHTLATFVELTLALLNTRISVKKLRQMMFGGGTEPAQDGGSIDHRERGDGERGSGRARAGPGDDGVGRWRERSAKPVEWARPQRRQRL